MPDSTESQAPTGRVQLGEYIIEERVGAGGMGQVYRARQPSLDRMVALKVLPRSVAANRDAVSRFYREAKNAAGLVHPNIVQIYTVGEERGVPYFAMEFVEGEDLEKRLESGKPLSTDDVVGIVASVAMALACAEEHGIVHRDIKPGNVMIDRHGVVKVTDFGLAKAVKFFETEITQAGFVVGTPTYMSPEQGTGKEVDNRADIYSLGVVFYELLCGRPPFQSEDPATLIYKHVHEPPVPPWEIRKEVPEEVARLCLKCLAKKPEDRYQSAAELLTDAYNVQEARLSAVSALSAGAQASAASAEGQAVQPPGDSAIVFDRRMAKLVMSSGVAPKPKAAAARLRVMGWLRSHWPVAAAAAGGVLVVAAALVILLGRGSRPDAGRPAEAGLTAPPGEQVQVHRAAADAGRSVLPLSNLNKTLAAGLCVEVRIGENPPLRLAAGSLKDLHVDPGPVAVAIFREHYEKLKIDMAMTQEGPSTDLRGVTYVPKPDEKLGGLLADATRAIDEERFQDARQALGAIRGMDPEAAFLGDIEASLAAASDRWDSRLSGVFEEGERLRRAGDLGGAASCFKGIPPGHRRYADARSLLDLIVAETQKVDRNIAEAETRLHRGDLAAARAAYSMLTGTLRVPAERLADLAERIETAEGLLSEADDADARQDHAVMRARLRSLAEVCPDSEAVARRLARVEMLIAKSGQAKKLAADIEDLLAKKDYERARSALAELQVLDPGGASVAEMARRIRREEAADGMRGVLAGLDKALVEFDGQKMAALIDPESPALAASARESTKGLAAGGVRFARSRHKLLDFELDDAGARANVTWEFVLDVPDARGRVSGAQGLATTFRRRAGGWRISALAAEDRLDAAFDGAGEEEPRIQGRVTSVDGALVGIDRGTAHGVKLKMIFALYRDARVMELPLVRKVVVRDEERIAEARVVDVSRDGCLASILGPIAGAPVAQGMLAVEMPLNSVAGAAPAIIGIRPSAPAAPWPGAVDLDADVRNVDGLPAYYLWAADGGRVLPKRTTVPRTRWFAPPEAGEYRITVTVVSPLGAGESSIALRSGGTGGAPAREVTPAREIVIGAPFEAVADLAFDEANRAYVLDGRTRKLLSIESEFETVRASWTCPGGLPLGVEVAHGHVFVLDGSSRSVRRFPLNDDPFAASPTASYGGPGRGNGRLVRPVDFAVSPTGDVAVLDQGAGTVQVFDPNGLFIQSFGTDGRTAGALFQAKAIVCDAGGDYYVLDAGRGQVVAFRNGRYSGEFPVGLPEGEPADLAYDAVGEHLAVLDGILGEVVLYTTGGEKLPGIAPPSGGRPSKGEPPLGELASPLRIVCDGASRLYVVSGSLQSIDRFELPRAGQTGDARPVFAGRLSATAPTGFTRLAAADDGTLCLLDKRAGLLWVVGEGGWRTASLGGQGAESPWSDASDVATGGGRFFVLDTALSTVRAFDADAQRSVRFGKKGRPEEPDGLQNPVAVAATRRGGKDGLVAVLLRSEKYSVHLFRHDGTDLAPFADAPEAVQPGSAVAVDGGGNVHVASQGMVQSFRSDGTALGETKMPAGAPQGMAVCADGTLYVLLDSRSRVLVAVRPLEGRVAQEIELPRTVRAPSAVACNGYGTVFVLDGRARTVFTWSRASGQGDPSAATEAGPREPGGAAP